MINQLLAVQSFSVRLTAEGELTSRPNLPTTAGQCRQWAVCDSLLSVFGFCSYSPSQSCFWSKSKYTNDECPKHLALVHIQLMKWSISSTSVYCLTDIFVLAYRETDNIPLIALGLKETKEVDFSTPFKVQFSFSSSDVVFIPFRKFNDAKGWNLQKSILMFHIIIWNKFVTYNQSMGCVFIWRLSATKLNSHKIFIGPSLSVAYKKSFVLWSRSAQSEMIQLLCANRTQTLVNSPSNTFTACHLRLWLSSRHRKRSHALLTDCSHTSAVIIAPLIWLAHT